MGFFDSFTGKSQRKDIEAAYNDSTRMMREGYETGRGDIIGGRDAALGTLNPFVEGGGRVNALLLDYLGANGLDAQKAAFANFQNDPGFQQQLDAGVSALDRSATARGGLYSGAAMKGVANFGQQFQRQAFNDRINALSGQAGQGLQAAGAAAGIQSEAGNNLGNMAFGFGQQNAANRINMGNATAATRGMGWQNALNLAGTIGKAAVAFSDIRLKRDIARVGALPSGLPVYDFKYAWADEPQRGVMAHEARELFPEAVSEGPGGFLMVDYSRIG